MNPGKAIIYCVIALFLWFIFSLCYHAYNGGDIDDVFFYKEKMAAKFYAQEQERILDKKIELLKRQLEIK